MVLYLNQGKGIKDGLSHLPDELLNKFYIAKLASGDLCEVDALEDVLLEISEHSLVPTRSWNPSSKPAAVMSKTI